MQMRQCFVLGLAFLTALNCGPLGPEQETGKLNVHTPPYQWLFARIYLDGVDTGHTTPFEFENVPVGEHTVRIVHPQIVDAERMVEVLKDRTTYVSFEATYRAIPLTVTSEPAGAQVIIDGYETGQETPATIPVASPLDREIEVRLLKTEFLPERMLLEFGPADSVLTFATQLTPVPTPAPTILYAVRDTLYEASLDGLTSRIINIGDVSSLSPFLWSVHRNLSWSKDKSVLALAGHDHLTLLNRDWSVRTRVVLGQWHRGISEISWSASNRYLIFSSSQGVWRYNTETGEQSVLIGYYPGEYVVKHSSDICPGDSLFVFLTHSWLSYADWTRWRTARTGYLHPLGGFETRVGNEDVHTVWLNDTAVLYKVGGQGLWELNPVDGTTRMRIADDGAKQLIVSGDRSRFAFLGDSRVHTGPVDFSRTVVLDLPDAVQVAWEEETDAFAYLKARAPEQWPYDSDVEVYWRTPDGTHHLIVNTVQTVSALSITPP